MYKLRKISAKIHDLKRLYSVLLLTGPRQTGKTTLCRELFSTHQWVLLDEEAILSMARAQPDLFLQNFPPPVIYDEVQRATNLFLSIKSNVDRTKQKSGARFVLTGSQPLTLMASVSD